LAFIFDSIVHSSIASGHSASNIGDWLRGRQGHKRSPDHEQLRKASESLNLEAGWLAKGVRLFRTTSLAFEHAVSKRTPEITWQSKIVPR
jgi:hypothetical protein